MFSYQVVFLVVAAFLSFVSCQIPFPSWYCWCYDSNGSYSQQLTANVCSTYPRPATPGFFCRNYDNDGFTGRCQNRYPNPNGNCASYAPDIGSIVGFNYGQDPGQVTYGAAKK
ncbi:hypothetical protein BGW37DRAFT_501283 [Umbelopsis sp. PMI_123]|nr:hypothetical protein BGW37DRAFT_501283 [Umbelopsis sp. PMI_123]